METNTIKKALMGKIKEMVDGMIEELQPYMEEGFHFPSIYIPTDSPGAVGVKVASRYSQGVEGKVKSHPSPISVWQVKYGELEEVTEESALTSMTFLRPESRELEEVTEESDINILYYAVKACDTAWREWSAKKTDISETLAWICDTDPIPKLNRSRRG